MQLHLLATSHCIQDLLNVCSITREISCDNCRDIAPNSTLNNNVVLRHRAVIGEDLAFEVCSRCARRLSLARPVHYCSICFEIVLDFLCARSTAELTELFRGPESAVIAIEQRTVRDSAN